MLTATSLLTTQMVRRLKPLLQARTNLRRQRRGSCLRLNREDVSSLPKPSAIRSCASSSSTRFCSKLKMVAIQFTLRTPSLTQTKTLTMDPSFNWPRWFSRIPTRLLPTLTPSWKRESTSSVTPRILTRLPLWASSLRIKTARMPT